MNVRAYTRGQAGIVRIASKAPKAFRAKMHGGLWDSRLTIENWRNSNFLEHIQWLGTNGEIENPELTGTSFVQNLKKLVIVLSRRIRRPSQNTRVGHFTG